MKLLVNPSSDSELTFLAYLDFANHDKRCLYWDMCNLSLAKTFLSIFRKDYPDLNFVTVGDSQYFYTSRSLPSLMSYLNEEVNRLNRLVDIYETALDTIDR
jgi:hypothetical protein